MRVLLPVHIQPPDGQAGVERYTERLATELGRHAEVAIATTRKVLSLPTGHVRRRDRGGLAVWEAVNALDHDGPEGTWARAEMEAAFREILEAFRPDVVHVQHLMYWSAALPRLARESGARVLVTLHDFWWMCGRMGQLTDFEGRLCRLPSAERCPACLSATPFAQPPAARRWIRRLVALRAATGVALDEPLRRARRLLGGAEGAPRAADDLEPWRAVHREREAAFRAAADHVDLFVTPSESLRARFVEWGLPAERIVRVAQGRDHAPFEALPPRAPRERARRFGFLGTVAPHKGVLELVHAFGALDVPDATLTVYGPLAKHPAYAERVRAAAARDARVRIAGPVPAEDVPRVLAGLDVSCVPSLWDECCPLTIQEAFLAGTPVLASDLGGSAELVRPRAGGLLAPAGDVAAWTELLRAVAGDDALYRALVASLPAVPRLAAHVEELLGLYAR